MCDAEVIRKNDLRFDENLSVGEDLSFFCTYLYEQSVGYLDEYLYTYILRDGGANLQNQSNARKRIENKTKLISARLKLDELALQLYGADVSIRPRACFSPSYNKVKSQTKHVWLLTLL